MSFFQQNTSRLTRKVPLNVTTMFVVFVFSLPLFKVNFYRENIVHDLWLESEFEATVVERDCVLHVSFLSNEKTYTNHSFSWIRFLCVASNAWKKTEMRTKDKKFFGFRQAIDFCPSWWVLSHLSCTLLVFCACMCVKCAYEGRTMMRSEFMKDQFVNICASCVRLFPLHLLIPCVLVNNFRFIMCFCPLAHPF